MIKNHIKGKGISSFWHTNINKQLKIKNKKIPKIIIIFIVFIFISLQCNLVVILRPKMQELISHQKHSLWQTKYQRTILCLKKPLIRRTIKLFHLRKMGLNLNLRTNTNPIPLRSFGRTSKLMCRLKKQLLTQLGVTNQSLKEDIFWITSVAASSQVNSLPS